MHGLFVLIIFSLEIYLMTLSFKVGQYEDGFFNIIIYISEQDVQNKGYEKGAFVE